MWKSSYFCCRIGFQKGRPSPEDQKGTPVEIRDYTRSCKFHNDAAYL